MRMNLGLDSVDSGEKLGFFLKTRLQVLLCLVGQALEENVFHGGNWDFRCGLS